MTITIIITISILLLIAYVFDLTSSKTKIPSVILLLLLGWILRQVTDYIEIPIPKLSPALPILGTIGLVLIVLEGSLELEFNKKKAPLIIKSLLTAVLPMLVLAFGLAYVFFYFGETSLKNNLINAIPLCVISSAIAIPSVHGLLKQNKDFVIYESSLSDIVGVLLFNFIALNTSFGIETFGRYFLLVFIMILVSFSGTLGLSYLLNKVEHRIKFVPIILLIILIYEVSKIYHLPSLIFILIFGLFLGNLDEIKMFSWIKKLRPEELNKEVLKFKELVVESAFLIRSLFFLLFGFLIETEELLNADTFVWAVCITVAIYILRAIQLALSKIPFSPLLFIAPRGLITILLFLSISPENAIFYVNKSLIIQIIVLTALVMMVGLMTNKTSVPEEPKENTGKEPIF